MKRIHSNPKNHKSLILWLDEIGIEDIALVGGKNASLGEMRKKTKVKIPNGFVVTAYAYRLFLEKAGLLDALKEALKGLDIRNQQALDLASEKARNIILNSELPPELVSAITKAYKALSNKYKTRDLDVAVRSSATAEDLPHASFAGQQESFLNISGIDALLKACKRSFASLFTSRAIVYRQENKFDHFKVYLSIGIQKMIRSDLASAGVIFTLDTETGFKNVLFITGSYGLGESVVQGAVNPDEFYVFKPTLEKGFKPIIDKRLGEKASKIIYSKSALSPTKRIDTPLKERNRFCLSDKEILQLSKWSLAIEKHYSKRYGKWTPMDIEWAKDGKTKELYIVQARPETVQSQRKSHVIEEYRLLEKGKVLAKGKSVGNKIAIGIARVIKSPKEISKFKKGEILVTEITDPDWVPIMKRASAIITDRGGRTSHAAIVSRELGLPCIVGTIDATKKIKTGDKVTVSPIEGENGIVYEGHLKFSIKKINIEKASKTQTKLMLNVSCPDDAFELSFLKSDGVGLAREEFIVTEYIKIHPMALANFEKVKDKKTRDQINRMTAGYEDKREYFIDKLSKGAALIAAAFYPNDVIFRFSDFKTNEYVNLVGGKYFEPKEENPMIGWRGASRYYNKNYLAGFKLECSAIKRVREKFGLHNLKVMIPVCRTLEEGKKVLMTMKKNGLIQGKEKLEVYVMCELPSNALLIDKFSDLFDGFSIGSNDLTQMTLGVDRDNERVADIFDERNEAVLTLIKQAIARAKKRGKKIGICGDAPSTYPEFAKFLVQCGIDSISLSPDAFLKTRALISKYEKEKRRR